MMRHDPLLRLVESFFQVHLRRVRGASQHTIFAYRDALRLLFLHIAKAKKKDVARLSVNDVTVDRVLAFLDALERDRRNGVATRNARLTAIRSFCRHMVREDPTRAGQYQRVLALPSKKARVRVIPYLEPEEVDVVLQQPDMRTPSGIRDHALLLLLYNTGARISEALVLRWPDVHLCGPRQVHLHGKGRKDRIVPIWPETVRALKRLLVRQKQADGFVFNSARGQPLSRDGAAYLLRKHVRSAAKTAATLRRKRVTPHVLRHSCAVGLLQSGVDLSVIRDYLGHESVATTGRYTRTNLKTKRRVLEKFWQRAGLSRTRNPQWRPSPSLLAFLSSL